MKQFSLMALVIAGPLSVLGASAPSADGVEMAVAAQATNPCSPKTTTPPPPSTTSPKAPTNLRIIGGSGGDPFEETGSGPFVNEETFDDATTGSEYFDMLAARPDCFVAFTLRNQAEIDSIATGAAGDAKWDVIYDAANDAMLQRAKGELNGVKMGLNMEQKQPFLGVKRTSMLLTYDFKIGPGAKYQGEGYLKQYKAYRLDAGTGSTELWLSTKLKFPTSEGIAEMLTTGGWYAGPGVTFANSEILEPRIGRFFPKVNTWTRYWLYVEGSLGGASAERTELVYISIWAADVNTAPVQLYNRLPMYSPVTDIRRFRFEFNTSETGAVNPLIEIWGRNFVVLTGLTLADAKALLQKPVN